MSYAMHATYYRSWITNITQKHMPLINYVDNSLDDNAFCFYTHEIAS